MAPRSPTLVQLAEGLWFTTGPVQIVGMPLTTTMVVLRLADGSLLLHSPVAMSEELCASVTKLGPIAHLYAPNLFHHRWIGDWAAAFPTARTHAPPGLTRKRPDLRVDRIQGEAPEPAFFGSLEELPIRGFRLRETALLHRATGTLVVADLVHNVGRPRHAWSAAYTRMMGFYGRVALSRVLRFTAFDDRRAARQSMDAVLSHPFDKVVVGHGEPLSAGGREAVAAAYGWLKG
jgi:hypothetical protein